MDNIHELQCPSCQHTDGFKQLDNVIMAVGISRIAVVRGHVTPMFTGSNEVFEDTQQEISPGPVVVCTFCGSEFIGYRSVLDSVFKHAQVARLPTAHP